MLIGFLNGWLYARDTPRQSNKSATWPWQRLRLPSVTKVLLNGLLTGLLIDLFYELVTTPPQMGYTFSNFLTVGGNSALVGALIFVLFDGLLAIETTEIVPAEVFGWSWRRAARGLIKFLLFGLFGSLLMLLLTSSSSGLYGLYWWYMHATDTILTLQLDWWTSLPYLLLIALMVGLLGALAGGLSSNVLDERNHTKPNQGIYRSARHSLFVGLGEGIAGGLMLVVFYGILVYVTLPKPSQGPKTFPLSAIPVMLVLGLIFALFVGLISGLRGGGLACIMHLILRVLL